MRPNLDKYFEGLHRINECKVELNAIGRRVETDKDYDVCRDCKHNESKTGPCYICKNGNRFEGGEGVKDNINPDHYKSSTSLECIEAMELVFGRDAVYNFCICNAWKYIWRWKNKNGIEDLHKVDWYLHRATRYSNADMDMIRNMRAYISEQINKQEES